MGDDYEILDPTRADAKTSDDAAPSTPIMSSIKQPVIDAAAQASSDGGGGSDKKVESGKKKEKGRKNKAEKTVEKKGKQAVGGAELEYVYEYESTASSLRRAFLIASGSGFLICAIYSLLGIINLTYNKQSNHKNG
ncbi:unnamed protein product [Litomosoides sigmodontis]|uniref:Uncharacterized protein n=1 Tax=Litomosoides sigmodontis TaxID=42156 RepID=A0A3P6UJD7_LITSI|nr:unnamed protein product [Litomosoides sigmodontis]